MTPVVSVLMPVFNGEKYLREAIESILMQSYHDYEFIIINDGSTDQSEAIIQSFTDPRIRYFNNGKNIGLTPSLNKGVLLAKGTYLARMDCDDISLPDRLKVEVEFLKNNPDYVLVCTQIELIDEQGVSAGFWEEDIKTKNHAEIKATLPRSNCIAHPTVLIKTNIAKEYLYSQKQYISEDWDLWMRLASDKRKLGKINKAYLQYRIHPASFTHQNNAKGVLRKIIRVQSNFIFDKFSKGKINSFDLSVLLYLFANSIRYCTGQIAPKYQRSIKKLFSIKIPAFMNRIRNR